MARRSAIYKRSTRGALRQGEILSNLVQAHLDLESLRKRGVPRVLARIHPFAIVISQDCDLDWDYKARKQMSSQPELPPSELSRLEGKMMPGILFCEVISAETLRGRNDINSSLWSQIKINKDERYQFLEKVPSFQDALGEGLPELGVDFKRYFTIPADEVYFQIHSQRILRLAEGTENFSSAGRTMRRCRLTNPYLEHFITRFNYFQSRIALPAEHFSEPVLKA